MQRLSSKLSYTNKASTELLSVYPSQARTELSLYPNQASTELSPFPNQASTELSLYPSQYCLFIQAGTVLLSVYPNQARTELSSVYPREARTELLSVYPNQVRNELSSVYSSQKKKKKKKVFRTEAEAGLGGTGLRPSLSHCYITSRLHIVRTELEVNQFLQVRNRVIVTSEIAVAL